MAFRSVMIESPARLSVRNGQLIICADGEHTLPLEDVNAVLLESRQSTITAAALSAMGQSGCALYVCDGRHMPCAVLTPFQQHGRGPAVLRDQLNAGEPLKKRLWQMIARQKIRNQAACLRLAGWTDEADTLAAMAKRVRSGDPDNVEATAAQYYFPALFGPGFTRADGSGYNAALNYGYAVLRGCVARTLATYGFLPALGLHHRSGVNPFNLADDLIEPFRPIVDLLVFREGDDGDELTPPVKRLLFDCLNLDTLSGGQHHSVSYAVERLTQSLGRALEEREANLTLPELLEPCKHRYE